jgi:hypothetical protein
VVTSTVGFCAASLALRREVRSERTARMRASPHWTSPEDVRAQGGVQQQLLVVLRELGLAQHASDESHVEGLKLRREWQPHAGAARDQPVGHGAVERARGAGRRCSGPRRLRRA